MDNDKLATDTMKDSKAGIAYGIATYLLWGVLPLYWKLLDHVPSEHIFAHRIVWSFVFLVLVLTFTGRWAGFRQAFADKFRLLVLAINGLILSANWYTYIWAVNHDRVIEASLGYYINPLLTILVGSIFLKERHNLLQWGAVLSAAIGVMIMTLKFGQVPVVALILAVAFTVYGFLKKVVKVDSLVGLALETLVVVPFAAAYIVYNEVSGLAVLAGASGSTIALLLGTGIATALPLILFGFASKRVTLSTLGFIQFLSPTMSLFLGVFVFHEAFTSTHAVSFLFIWGAVILYTLGSRKPLTGQSKPSLMKAKNDGKRCA